MQGAQMWATVDGTNRTTVPPQLPPSAETPEGKQYNHSKGITG